MIRTSARREDLPGAVVAMATAPGSKRPRDVRFFATEISEFRSPVRHAAQTLVFRPEEEGFRMATLKTGFNALRKFALGFPETREDHPWGESAIKVKGKTFVFMGCDRERLGLSVKLPQSREFALEYPFTKPTAYSLGKSGWVTAEFLAKDAPPLDILQAWIEESFHAIAPKKVAALRAAVKKTA